MHAMIYHGIAAPLSALAKAAPPRAYRARPRLAPGPRPWSGLKTAGERVRTKHHVIHVRPVALTSGTSRFPFGAPSPLSPYPRPQRTPRSPLEYTTAHIGSYFGYPIGSPSTFHTGSGAISTTRWASEPTPRIPVLERRHLLLILRSFQHPRLPNKEHPEFDQLR